MLGCVQLIWRGLMAEASPENILDVVIVGAGFAGMYALHSFRGMGLQAKVL